MAHLTTYLGGSYDGFETSPEVLAAIEACADDRLLDEGSRARRIWEAPDPHEMAIVATEAFRLHDAQAAGRGEGAEVELYWGAGEAIRRP